MTELPRTASVPKVAITVAGLARLWGRSKAIASLKTRDIRIDTALGGCVDLEAALARRPIAVSEAEFESVLRLEASRPDGGSTIALARSRKLYATAAERRDEIAHACRPGVRPRAVRHETVALQADQRKRAQAQTAAAVAALQAERLKAGEAAEQIVARCLPVLIAALGGLPSEVERLVAEVAPADAGRIREAVRRQLQAGMRTAREALRAELLGEAADISML